MNLARLLTGQMSCLYSRHEVWSEKDVLGLAVGLRGLINKLSRTPYVAILSENSPFFVASYLAVLSLGKIAVLLPVDITPNALSAQIDLCMISTRQETSLSFESIISEPETPYAGDNYLDIVERDCDSVAVILFTSGSTSEPKGVLLTHENLICNAKDIISYMQLTCADRAMLVLPLTYTFGLSVLNTHMAVGADIVLNNGFMFPSQVLDDIEAKECTGFAGVPSHYQMLMNCTDFLDRNLPSVQWFQQAGGNLPSADIRRVVKSFVDKKFFVMYGQTEGTARLSYLPPDKIGDKLGSIGKGLPSTKLEVLLPDGRPVDVGEIGEIVASGKNISPGYWMDPDESAGTFIHGKLHTGDMAKVDADCYIYIVGRKKSFIKVMGYRVSAKEVEEVLLAHPNVSDTFVIGIPHDLTGEAIRAYVSGVGEVTEQSIQRWCSERLPNYKVPQDIHIIDHIPRTQSGKIDGRKLHEINRII